MIDQHRKEYPSNQQIQNQAASTGACGITAGHLSAKDMIWSVAMVSDQKLTTHKTFPSIHQDEYLDNLLSYGILDCMEGEPRNQVEEKCFCYMAVCSLFVYDHCILLEQKVRRPLGSPSSRTNSSFL